MGNFVAQPDPGAVRQVGGIGHQPPLMLGMGMKDVETLTEEFVRLAGQQMFQRGQGLDAGLVDVVDREIGRIQRHHVERHFVQHLHQPGGLLVCLNLLRDDAPGQHGLDIVALRIGDGGHQQIENLVSQLDVGLKGQVGRIPEQVALMLGLGMKDIDALAKQIVGLAGEQMFQWRQGLNAGCVDEIDGEIVQIQRHHIYRHVVDHLAVCRDVHLGDAGMIHFNNVLAAGAGESCEET